MNSGRLDGLGQEEVHFWIGISPNSRDDEKKCEGTTRQAEGMWQPTTTTLPSLAIGRNLCPLGPERRSCFLFTSSRECTALTDSTLWYYTIEPKDSDHHHDAQALKAEASSQDEWAVGCWAITMHRSVINFTH